MHSSPDMTVGTLSAGYAKPILQVLDPAGTLFAKQLYRDAITATLHHRNVKVRHVLEPALPGQPERFSESDLVLSCPVGSLTI